MAHCSVPKGHRKKVLDIFDVLKQQFEGREAIYIEKGVLRVEVNNIALHPSRQEILATLAEIPTVGLGFGSSRSESDGTDPIRVKWRIGAGFLTTFSNDTWNMGYGGWTLFFAPHIVAGVAHLASKLASNYDWLATYNASLKFIYSDRHCDVRTRYVFPKPTKNSKATGRLRLLGSG